ncbi:KCNB2, partial [Symbiodinium microadriaticum]
LAKRLREIGVTGRRRARTTAATGDQADKLVKLVGKCNPALEEELRIYIGRFPGEIRTLLARGKQVYKEVLANQRRGGTQDTRTAELRRDKKDKAKKVKDKKKQKGKKEEKKEGKKKKKQKKSAKEGKQYTVDAGDSNKSHKTEDVQHHTTANPSPEEMDAGDPNKTHKTEDVQYLQPCLLELHTFSAKAKDDETELDTAQNAATNLGGSDSDSECTPTAASE